MRKTIKIFIIIILIIEILMSIIICFKYKGIIIGNYNQGKIYNIICDEINIPDKAVIKCIVTNRMIFRDATYEVYYKSDKLYSKIFRLELTDSRVDYFERQSHNISIYCIVIISITALGLYMIRIK